MLQRMLKDIMVKSPTRPLSVRGNDPKKNITLAIKVIWRWLKLKTEGKKEEEATKASSSIWSSKLPVTNVHVFSSFIWKSSQEVFYI